MFYKILKILSVTMALWSVNAHAGPTFRIAPPAPDSNDGVIKLSWDLPENSQIELQQINLTTSKIKTLYIGPDNSTVITGLPDGQFKFRGRLVSPDTSPEAWSEPVKVTVTHHPLSRAALFFMLGALVFVMTVGLIIMGSRQHNSGKS